MSLNSDQLDAFFEVARLGSFSKAAAHLAVSQPALSQRIKKLEDAVEATLFIRESARVALTETGHRLLLYCRNKRDLEADFLSPNSKEETVSVIRLAGFSSVLRSCVLPALANLMNSEGKLQLELVCSELYDLPGLLKNAQADFVLTERPISSQAVESVLLGQEENILIEAAKPKGKIPEIYFDHDPEDKITFEFFKKNKRKTTSALQRSFLGEIYTIIDAVEQGWGRAVVPRHLIRDNKKIQEVKDFAPMKTEVYLNYYHQPFYLPLHKAVIKELTKYMPPILGG